MRDDLGNRMKSNYENRTRTYLPRRTNTIIRIDGKAFHTYTKGRKKPFDDELMYNMDLTATALCEEIQGAKLAYVQSDEISILVTDYDKEGTCAWFDGNIQKICSVSASIATAEFNQNELVLFAEEAKIGEGFGGFSELDIALVKPALFDSRVFIIPEISEVANYFLWRCQDCSRNSVQMVARSLYSHKECENKNSSELQDMIQAKGRNWNDLSNEKKYGRIIVKLEATEEGDRSYWLTLGAKNYTYDYWLKMVKERINKK